MAADAPAGPWLFMHPIYTVQVNPVQGTGSEEHDMQETTQYIDLFDAAIRALFSDAVRITLRDPSIAVFFMRMRHAQHVAERRRARFAREGVHVPPFMILSVTGRCNLACAGCYAQAQGRQEEAEMAPADLLSVVRQGSDLGVGIILLAGGEPMTRADEILTIAHEVPDVVFPVFTNGTLLVESLVSRIRGQRNIIPVISLEGHTAETDARRGEGVAGQAKAAIARMRKAGVFFGTSLTVTRLNIDTVLDEEYLRGLAGLGCRLFFFVEYVPVREGTELLVLDGAQRARLAATVASLQHRLRGLFIAFPGDEEALGGCLAAGRGFIHVSPSGRVEPCPFAPYSDTSVRDVPLRDALASPLLAAIRENHDKLTETSGGCALWSQREWVESLLEGCDGAETVRPGRPHGDARDIL
ncbi:MAG TPA: radical SAM protein [Clostridia bacterium]|nr:radical SAM protein [Clostridia bacterium]